MVQHMLIPLSHFDPRPDAATIDQMPLETFCGPALCLDVSDFPERSTMGPEVIKNAEKKADLSIEPGDILLLYTGHFDRNYGKQEWVELIPVSARRLPSIFW